MGTTTEAVRKRFDRWAGRYEQDPVSRWLATLQQPALAALELRPEDRFLDMGCGSGAAVREAAKVVKRAVGIDVSPKMVEQARHLGGDLENVEFREEDARHLSFRDGEFTAVLCTSAFHHYTNPRSAVKEMSRVLASSGRVVIGDGCADRRGARVADFVLRHLQSSHVGFYRSTELGTLLFDAGFDRVRLRLLLGGGYMLVRAEKRG